MPRRLGFTPRELRNFDFYQNSWTRTSFLESKNHIYTVFLNFRTLVPKYSY